MRNSKWSIVFGILNLIQSSVISFVAFAIFMKEKIVLIIALYVGIIFIVLPIFQVIRWYVTTVTILNGNVVYKKGVIFKSTSTLSLDKIANVHMEQSLVNRWIKCCRLTIESGSAGGEMANIVMTLPTKKAEELQKHLLPKEPFVQEESTEERKDERITLTKKELFLYGLTRSAIFSLIGLLFSSYFFFKEVCEWFAIDFSHIIKQGVILLIREHIWLFFTGVILLYVVAKIITAIATLLSYYGFQLYQESNRLVVKHGYFTKKEYAVPQEKIYGIKLKQSLLFQLFGLYTIEVCTMGDKSDSGERKMLYPLASKETVDSLMEEFVPDFVYKENVLAGERGKISRFFIAQSISVVILTVVLMFVHPLFSLLGLTIPIIILNGYLQYKYASIGHSGKLIYGCTGGIFNSIYYVLPYSLQSYEYSTNYFQRRNRICTFKVSLWSGSFKMKHLDKKAVRGIFEDK